MVLLVATHYFNLQGRGAELTLKMFLAENLSVEDRAVKFAASASSATALEGALYHDWAEAQNIWQIVDATFAYAVHLFSIRQHDYSG